MRRLADEDEDDDDDLQSDLVGSGMMPAGEGSARARDGFSFQEKYIG
jgi:hypothetical protein